MKIRTMCIIAAICLLVALTFSIISTIISLDRMKVQKTEYSELLERYLTYKQGNLCQIQKGYVRDMSATQMTISAKQYKTGEEVWIMLDRTLTCYADLNLGDSVYVLTYIYNGNYEYVILTSTEFKAISNIQ